MALLRKNAKIELLKRVPLFADCSKDELAEIAALADEIYLPGERDLTRQGESGKEFVVLVEGEADVLRDGDLIAGLGAGDFVGEIALVTGEPRNATVRTRGPARVLVVNARSFRKLMDDVPSIQTRVLMAAAARVPREFD